MTQATKPNKLKERPFEEALTELDRLVNSMENGQLPLDQLLENYKKGADLLKLCKHKLEAVEDQIKMLEGSQESR